MPPAGATWLGGDALNNTTIKDYLKRYSPQKWPEVTKLTLIYGVVALQHSYGGRVLSLQELQQAVERSNTTLVVQRNVPQLQRQILQLQSQLDSVFDKLAPEGPASAGPSQQLQIGRAQQKELQQPQQQQQQQHGRAAAALLSARQARVRNPAVAHPKPSDAWRQGEASGFVSPPRSKAHPLRRSIDNQGATNPIYPDWWLSESDTQRGADQQQQLQPPRLAFPQPGQQQLAMSATNLLASQQQQQLFSSRYGQQQLHLEQTALEAEPTLLLSQATADGITSQPYQQQAELTLAQQGPARTTAADEAGTSRAAAASHGRGPAAVVLGRALPSLKHVESKIKQSVEASRQKAAAQQQQRQRLLASVVATSSSHSPGQQQQHRGASVEEACPPAATAEQFISNPWTSWFVPGAPADLSIPAAAAAVAAQGSGSSDDVRSSCRELVGTEAVHPGHSQASCEVVEADAAAGSRSALQDITGELNQLKCSSSDGNAVHKPPPTEPWGLSASDFGFAQGNSLQQHAGNMQHKLHGTAAAAGLQWPAGQPQQQQPTRAWAADFGHLESAQLEVAAQQAAAAGAARRRAGPHHQRQQWMQRWVGDYGHLERLARPAPFSHHQQQQADADSADDTAADAAAGAAGSGLFQSPADLRDLLGSAAAAAAAQQVTGGDTCAADLFQQEASAGGQVDEAASYAAMAAAAEAAEGEAQMASASHTGLSFGVDELLRLHGVIRATDSPTKRTAAAVAATQFDASLEAELAAAGSSSSSAADELGEHGHVTVGVDADDGEADLAGSFLEGLGETSAMLRAALAQHSSVMQLVGMLDGLGASPGQAGAAQEGQQQARQQEAVEEEAAAEWSSAAAQTAAWVAATAADGESAASAVAEAGL